MLPHPFYCEENVHRLCEDPRLSALEKRVVFISNDRRRVALFHQRAGDDEVFVLTWDYHVILLARSPGEPWETWDLGSTLGAPVPAGDYLRRTFEERALPPIFAPRFRVVEGAEFLATFSSDRAHMRRRNGSFTRPPPPWPAIDRGGAPNLLRFVDTRAVFVGEVMDLAGLRASIGVG